MGAPVSEMVELRRARPHWVYRLYDDEGELLYVGCTVDPVARFRGWFSRARSSYRSHRTSWFLDVRRVDWQQYPDWRSGAIAEKVAIETERPRHNRAHTPRIVSSGHLTPSLRSRQVAS